MLNCPLNCSLSWKNRGEDRCAFFLPVHFAKISRDRAECVLRSDTFSVKRVEEKDFSALIWRSTDRNDIIAGYRGEKVSSDVRVRFRFRFRFRGFRRWDNSTDRPSLAIRALGRLSQILRCRFCPDVHQRLALRKLSQWRIDNSRWFETTWSSLMERTQLQEINVPRIECFFCYLVRLLRWL